MFTSFMDRITTSFALARASWAVLVKDKQLALFPVVSGVATVLILISFAIPLGILHAVAPQAFDPDNNSYLWEVPVTFLFYLCTYFAIIFCNAALISCTLMRFEGQTPTLADGFKAAWARFPQIFAWAMVSATVGLILKLIENAHEKVGAFISAVLGTAWTIMTYFVVPILVVEKTGPFEAIRRSIQVMRKTWGETLVGQFGLGLFKFLLFLPALLFIIPGVLLVMAGLWPVAIPVLLLGVLYLLAWGAVGSAMDTIFLTALYQYAAFNTVPAGFDADQISRAFVPAKRVL